MRKRLGRTLFVMGIGAAAAFGALATSAEARRPIFTPCFMGECLDVWNPVICPNGQIYSNDCYARRACQTNCGPANY